MSSMACATLPPRTRKGRYDKGSHSFEIIAMIDPQKVTDASPYAKRFIETLFKLAGIQTPAG